MTPLMTEHADRELNLGQSNESLPPQTLSHSRSLNSLGKLLNHLHKGTDTIYILAK